MFFPLQQGPACLRADVDCQPSCWLRSLDCENTRDNNGNGSNWCRNIKLCIQWATQSVINENRACGDNVRLTLSAFGPQLLPGGGSAKWKQNNKGRIWWATLFLIIMQVKGASYTAEGSERLSYSFSDLSFLPLHFINSGAITAIIIDYDGDVNWQRLRLSFTADAPRAWRYVFLGRMQMLGRKNYNIFTSAKMFCTTIPLNNCDTHTYEWRRQDILRFHSKLHCLKWHQPTETINLTRYYYTLTWASFSEYALLKKKFVFISVHIRCHVPYANPYIFDRPMSVIRQTCIQPCLLHFDNHFTPTSAFWRKHNATWLHFC